MWVKVAYKTYYYFDPNLWRLHMLNFQSNDEVVDMDEVSKNEDTDVEEVPEKEPDTTLGEDTEIEEVDEKETDDN